MIPPKNCEITFREPFPRVFRLPNGNVEKYYIKACIGQGLEREITIDKPQQIDIIDYLLMVDLKLTGAIVRSDSQERWVVLQHSPATDFFDLVDEDKN